MKESLAPSCPRCNRSDDVKKIAYGVMLAHVHPEMKCDGFTLDGRCIRPDSPDWYCAICAESFGAWREFWGAPLTELIQ